MIEIKNLTKKFSYKVIFHNASFCLPNNGLFILDSDNGTGKTTLLKILSGIDHDYEGKILFNGEESSLDCEYLDQRNNYVTFLSVKDNFHLKSFIYKTDKDIDVSDRNKELLKRKSASTLSEGEKLLVLLERCEKSSAQVILLDEVTAPLDSDNVSKIFEKIIQLGKTKLVLFATHDGRLDLSALDKIIIEDFSIKVYSTNAYSENGTTSCENNKKVRKTPFKLFFNYLKSDLILSLITLCALSFLGVVFSMSFFDLSNSRAYILSQNLGSNIESVYRNPKPYTYGDTTFKDQSEIGLSLDDIAYMKENFVCGNGKNNNGNFVFSENNENCFFIDSDFELTLRTSSSDPNFTINNGKLIYRENSFTFEMDYKIADDYIGKGVFEDDSVLTSSRGVVDYDYFLSSFNPRFFGTNSCLFQYEFDQLDNKIDYFKSGKTTYFYEINDYLSDFKYENSIELKDDEVLVNKKYKELDGKTLEVVDNSLFDLGGDQNKYINLKEVFPHGIKVVYEESISDDLSSNLCLVNNNVANKMLQTMNFVDRLTIEADSKEELINFLLTGDKNSSENLFLTNYDLSYIYEGYYNAAIQYGINPNNKFMRLYMMPIFYLMVYLLFVSMISLYFNYEKNKHRHDFDLLRANGFKDLHFIIFKYLKLIAFYLISILPGIIICLVDPKLISYGSNEINYSFVNFNFLTFIYYFALFLIIALIFTYINKNEFRKIGLLTRRISSKARKEYGN